MIIKRLQLIIL